VIDGKPILNLPGRTVDIVACEFDKEEREFYTALEQQTALTFNKVRLLRFDVREYLLMPVCQSWNRYEQLHQCSYHATPTAPRFA
jgi:hypothetical protein